MPPVARTIGLAATLLACASGSLIGCRNRQNLAERVLDDPARELTTARCGGVGQIVRPLIIEWPATDRASLESRLRRGLVVVRYEGCVVEVLRDCAAPTGAYDYLGITRKNDQINIRTTDELYANMPLTAVDLQAKLEKAGELNVSMALVGNYEAQRARWDIRELQGRCQGATHMIAAAQVGAFAFYTGAAAEIGTEITIPRLQRGQIDENVAGVGGHSTASREILNRDGDANACHASTPNDTTPPNECGALLRLELSALDGIAPTCQPGSVWNGSACVTEQRAAQEAEQKREADRIARENAERAEKEAKHAENEQVAWQLCEIAMQCQAQMNGVLPPEGNAYQRQMRTCTTMMKITINDYTRPTARKCIADAPSVGCEAFQACVAGPQVGAPQADFFGESP